MKALGETPFCTKNLLGTLLAGKLTL